MTDNISQRTGQMQLTGAGEESEVYDHRTAMEILHYNQNLVQLADSKAGNLIIINSIFLASITSFMIESAHKTLSYPQLFQIGFFASSVIAIYFCLHSIMTKGDFSEKVRHLDLVFFGDIMHNKTPESYIFEFVKTKPKALLSDILRRIYATSVIADRKFNRIKLAQNFTLIASLLWVLNLLLIFVR